MKACPHCAEMIQDAAKVCRYCNRDLTAGNVPSPAQSSQVAQTYVRNPRSGKNKMLAGLGLLLLGFIIIGATGGENAIGRFIGIIVVTVGLLMVFYGKIQHWFHWE